MTDKAVICPLCDKEIVEYPLTRIVCSKTYHDACLDELGRAIKGATLNLVLHRKEQEYLRVLDHERCMGRLK